MVEEKIKLLPVAAPLVVLRVTSPPMVTGLLKVMTPKPPPSVVMSSLMAVFPVVVMAPGAAVKPTLPLYATVPPVAFNAMPAPSMVLLKVSAPPGAKSLTVFVKSRTGEKNVPLPPLVIIEFPALLPTREMLALDVVVSEILPVVEETPVPASM